WSGDRLRLHCAVHHCYHSFRSKLGWASLLGSCKISARTTASQYAVTAKREWFLRFREATTIYTACRGSRQKLTRQPGPSIHRLSEGTRHPSQRASATLARRRACPTLFPNLRGRCMIG